MAVVALGMMSAAGCAGGGGAQQPEILATYEKSGGIAGFNERLVVRNDGRLVLDDKRTGKMHEAAVDTGSLQSLRDLFASEDFQSAERSYRAERGADLITYTIEARTPGRTHTVTTMDSAGHPPVVMRAIEHLDHLSGLARQREVPAR
jgi:hypothetical protein